jgi:endonuclease/exonuclease/phosphatase (EEP) superfamily protein YafD
MYRSIKGSWKIAKAGKGFGETYKFRYYPARIDYIFAWKMKVKNLKTSQFINSDHFPIMARLSLGDHKSVFIWY